VAKAATRVPGAAFGATPAGQPFAGAIFTVGISVLLGSGSVGFGPMSAPEGNLDISLHATRERQAKRTGKCCGRIRPPGDVRRCGRLHRS
jgi:hypothetical protein